ncbi:MAG: alpha-ketoglutarate-dependent dioxygenase AlkB [Acidimicrobiales bacterium]
MAVSTPVAAVGPSQPSLLGLGSPAVDGTFTTLRRHELTLGAWIDHAPGWVDGHQTLFDDLLATLEWERQRRPMYDRIVDVPRLLGSLPHPAAGRAQLGVLDDMREALADHYGVELPRLGFALYRHGRDSVAWHGDKVGRELRQTVVATISLGEPRPFRLRPVSGGDGRRFDLGHGDLVVMGGTCQRTWEHSVPKVARAGPRMVLMFRPDWPSSD